LAIRQNFVIGVVLAIGYTKICVARIVGMKPQLNIRKLMSRRRPNWTHKPHKPLTPKPEIEDIKKTPKKIFIKRKDGSVEVIKK